MPFTHTFIFMELASQETAGINYICLCIVSSLLTNCITYIYVHFHCCHFELKRLVWDRPEIIQIYMHVAVIETYNIYVYNEYYLNLYCQAFYFRGQLNPNQFAGMKLLATSIGCDIHVYTINIKFAGINIRADHVTAKINTQRNRLLLQYLGATTKPYITIHCIIYVIYNVMLQYLISYYLL